MYHILSEYVSFGVGTVGTLFWLSSNRAWNKRPGGGVVIHNVYGDRLFHFRRVGFFELSEGVVGGVTYVLLVRLFLVLSSGDRSYFR